MRWAWLMMGLLVYGIAFPQDKLKIAVMDLKAKTGVDPMTASSLSEYVCTVVSDLNKYSVIGKDDMKALLEHMADKQLLECDDTKCLAEIGGALGVEQLLSGSVGMVGDMYLINLKIIDINEVSVINRISEKYQGKESGLVNEMERAVKQLLNVQVPGNPDDKGPIAVPKKSPEPDAASTTGPQKKWRIAANPAYLFQYSDLDMNGFALNAGINSKRHYWGISFDFCSFYNEHYSASEVIIDDDVLIGGGITYYYTLVNARYFHLKTGSSAGFWGEDYSYTNDGRDAGGTIIRRPENDVYDSYYYFVAPKISMELGYKRFFITSESIVYVGTELSFLHALGMCYYF